MVRILFNISNKNFLISKYWRIFLPAFSFKILILGAISFSATLEGFDLITPFDVGK